MWTTRRRTSWPSPEPGCNPVSAVWLCLRAELRARSRSWVVLALVVGAGCGVILATTAGARRTDSALTRYVSAHQLADASVVRGFWVDGTERLDLDRIEALPQVVAASRWARFAAIFRTRNGKPVLPDGSTGVAVSTWLDDRGGRDLERWKLLRGRAPQPGRPDEAVVDATAFERLGYAVDDTVTLRLASHAALWGRPSTAERLTADPLTTAVGPLVRLRIVGVVATLLEGPPGLLMLPTAFFRRHDVRDLGALVEGVTVRLRHGADDVPAFRHAAERIAGPGYPGIGTPESDRATAQRPMRLQARVLSILAGLGVVALLLFVAQAFAREGLARAPEHATLRALGVTRRQLVTIAACTAAVVGGVAAVVAMTVAILLSPLAPIGHARELEPSPGIQVDVVVLAVGSLALVLATVVAAIAVSLWSTRSRARGWGRGQDRPRRAPADVGARLGLSPTVVSGLRMALSRGRGPAAVPVGPTLAALVLAVTVVASAMTFSSSLSHLLSTPRLYGVNFDYLFWPEGPPAGRLPPDRRLLADPAITAIASATNGDVAVDGVPMVAAAQEDVKGTLPSATVVEGRLPRGPDEILLAPKTLGALHRRIGDVVTVRKAATAEMRIVGTGFAMRPLVGDHPWANGAVVTFSGLKRVDPAAVHTDYRLRISPSADRGAVLDRLERTIGLGRFEPPIQLAEFGGLAAFPLAFSVLFGVVGATMLAHALVASIRRRRRELAVLTTLGFDRRQIVATVAWQATTIASVGLVVGLPLGAALARFGWNVFANELGVVRHPVIPVWELVALIPVTLLVANLIAALPARFAARMKPTVALRAE